MKGWREGAPPLLAAWDRADDAERAAFVAARRVELARLLGEGPPAAPWVASAARRGRRR